MTEQVFTSVIHYKTRFDFAHLPQIQLWLFYHKIDHVSKLKSYTLPMMYGL